MEKIDKKELKKLFIQIKKNNKIAFEKLYNTYNKLVYSIALSIVKNKQDAEDIVQKIFTKIYSIDKNKLPSKNEASWLYSTTKNEAINFLKKKKNTIYIEEIYEIEDNNNEINKIIDKDSFNKLISGLSNQEKEIISLKILSNLSFEEIGTILDTPTGTIKWKYYKSMHTLKMLLSNLTMFIITSILSIITSKSQKKASIEDDTAQIPENIIQEDTSQTPAIEETKKQEEATFENNNSLIQESIVEIPNESNLPNYMKSTFIGVSTIFFILTIIFSIIFAKHQLKRRKKLSK